jgi:hypothetical protein
MFYSSAIIYMPSHTYVDLKVDPRTTNTIGNTGRGLDAISHMLKTIAMVVRSNQNGVRMQLRRAMNVTTTTLSCVERNTVGSIGVRTS